MSDFGNFAKIPDQDIETGGYTNVPDKKWSVIGFEFVCREDDPIVFKPDFQGTPKLLIKFNTEEGNVGPLCSLTASEFVLLVQAFGAEDFVPEPKTLTAESVLIEGQQKANSAAKPLSVESEGGFVNKLWHLLHLPEGRYKIKFTGVRKKDSKDFSWKESTFKEDTYESLPLVFEVVGDTLYRGHEIIVYLTNIFKKEYKGMVAKEIGAPIPYQGKNWERWKTLIKWFAPDIQQHEWVVDPLQSPYGVCEAEQPQYVILNKALESKKEVIVKYGKTDRGKWAVELADCDLIDLLNEKNQEQTKDYTKENIVEIIQSINFEVDEPVVISTDPIEFGPGWEAVREEYFKKPLVGIFAQAGIDYNEKQNLDMLTQKELNTLAETLQRVFGK